MLFAFWIFPLASQRYNCVIYRESDNIESTVFFRKVFERTQNKWNEEQVNADEDGMAQKWMTCSYEIFI